MVNMKQKGASTGIFLPVGYKKSKLYCTSSLSKEDDRF